MGLRNWLSKIKRDLDYSLNRTQITADIAFNKARSQSYQIRDSYKKSLIQYINSSIRDKIENGNMSLSIDITNSNKEFVPELLYYYRNLGYTAIVIDSSIIEELKPNEGCILLLWGRE